MLDEVSGERHTSPPANRFFGLRGEAMFQYRFGMKVLTEFLLATCATHLHYPFRMGRPNAARIISLEHPDQQWYMSGLAIEIAR